MFGWNFKQKCMFLINIKQFKRPSDRHLERTRKSYSGKFVTILPKSRGSSLDFKLKSYS